MSEHTPPQRFERVKDRLEMLWDWANAHPDEMQSDPERRKKLAVVEAEYMVARERLLELARTGREILVSDCAFLASQWEVKEESVRASMRRLGRERLLAYDSCWVEDIGRSYSWYVMPESVRAELLERERLMNDGDGESGIFGVECALVGAGSEGALVPEYA